jgi:hypothetical protein
VIPPAHTTDIFTSPPHPNIPTPNQLLTFLLVLRPACLNLSGINTPHIPTTVILRPVRLFGEPIEWVDRTRYLGVTLDTRLTWSPHIDQVRKRTAQRMGMLGPLLNRKSDLSVRNGVLLYKQLIRPMMDYACPAWKSAARSHVRRLQVLQSKCLCLATGAPWYVTNRQIHEDLGVPLFANHVRALRASTQSWLTWGTPLYGNSVDTYADRGLAPSL